MGDNMKLRELELQDAPWMLEWMHDKDVVANMQTDFAGKTLQDCEAFIEHSRNSTESLHLAVAGEDNVYMGTVSLKHITKDTAEFAIAVRKSAMGKGFAKYAMEEMIRIGLEDRKLKLVYWCVSPDNKRAIRFYEKTGYRRISQKESVCSAGGGYFLSQCEAYVWYGKTNHARGEIIG